ncbi:hypothetical protein Rvan_2345 [Rhodomicrobium vannielii ATCC 17100]|uniref:Rap1a immunity protein domain-containing protein n=1 Tax=Rhodomicrobium vannielii (strain ATCC 17100 / DSM 162 / LMG 4299 / NCIMB 10020 / ATH 3.1.1) TaxID=648757 RepID=E3I4I7_RHOVT|nr:Rap1a/Tai family immunity protein [Rhodomicrobium vannielii]ADP71569.1 hypothetical protein Rvan_2345 [Rhodomicrobium vannielii ATCC 17100]
MSRAVRRWIAAVLAIFWLAMTGAVQADDGYTAADMLADCKPILRLAKPGSNPDELELEDTFATGNCWGAFLTVQQLLITRLETDRDPLLQVCVPEGVSLLHLIQIFDRFARLNPARQTEPFTTVAMAALRSGFPCSGK